MTMSSNDSAQALDKYQPIVYSSRPTVSRNEWNAMTPDERISRFQSTDYVATRHPSATRSDAVVEDRKCSGSSSVSLASTCTSTQPSSIEEPQSKTKGQIPKSQSSSMLSDYTSSSRQNSRTFSIEDNTSSSRPSSKASWSEDKLFAAGHSQSERASSGSITSFNDALVSAPTSIEPQSIRRKPVKPQPLARRWSMLRSSSSANDIRLRNIEQLHSFNDRPGTADGRIGARTIKRSFSRRLGTIKRALSAMRD